MLVHRFFEFHACMSLRYNEVNLENTPHFVSRLLTSAKYSPLKFNFRRTGKFDSQTVVPVFDC